VKTPVGDLRQCRRKIRQAKAQYREEIYGLFIEAITIAERIARDPDELRIFIFSRNVGAFVGIIPSTMAPEKWLVFAVRYAFWGRGKAMQKRASKFAAVAELFVKERVTPDQRLKILRDRGVEQLAQLAANLRSQRKLLLGMDPIHGEDTRTCQSVHRGSGTTRIRIVHGAHFAK
jgi:hypothetical protein